MADTSQTFRSKYAGNPGSLVAIRVDYDRGTRAFESLSSDSAPVQARQEMQRLKQGTRLGDQPRWNTSVVPEGDRSGLPCRPMQRQNAEYQATKLEYNYRAATLPDCGKTAVFLPKANKMQVDRSLFLSARDKARLTTTCTGTSTKFSRSEATHTDGDFDARAKQSSVGAVAASVHGGSTSAGAAKPQWNVSTERPVERVNLWVRPKAGAVDQHLPSVRRPVASASTGYVSPTQRQQAIIDELRETKRVQREAQQKEEKAKMAHLLATMGTATGTTSKAGLASMATSLGPAVDPAAFTAYAEQQAQQRVFKMSNAAEWWPEDEGEDAIRQKAIAMGIVPVPQEVGSADHSVPQQPGQDSE